MLCAAAMMVQRVALHDGFLGLGDRTAIPAMLLAIANSIFLLLLVDTRLAHRLIRVTPTPAATLAAAALFFSEWLLGAPAGSMKAAIRCSFVGVPQRV
jgi:hypothetical protein